MLGSLSALTFSNAVYTLSLTFLLYKATDRALSMSMGDTATSITDTVTRLRS